MLTLKERKEKFVSDLLGGSEYEIYLVTGVALTAYMSFALLQKFNQNDLNLPIDYALNAVSILLGITLYSSNPKYLHVIIAVPALLALVLSYQYQKDPKVNQNKKNNKDVNILQRKSFVTAYRSHMIIITNFAILAVDFPVFPRRFAKVETWGTSLMDIGVGAFVFSMGLVNSRLLIRQTFDPSNSKYKFHFGTYLSLVWRNFVKSLPVLTLGLIRLVSVKSLEYQEHVTEYGIHWNFFFTLGALPIVIGILDPILNYFPRALVALVITSTYELFLTKTDLLTFILRTDNRMDSLILQNKEGIFSFFGYLSIFIFGQSFGSFVLTSFKTPQNLIKMSTYAEFVQSKKRKNSISSWLTVSTTEGLIISTIFYQFLYRYVAESPSFNNVSRRMANISYVLWVVSHSSTFLLGYNLVDRLVRRENGETGSTLLESTNNNGLLCFLLGNLLTGLVNMTINTLDTGDAVAFGILCTYGAILATVAILLNKNKIYIKI